MTNCNNRLILLGFLTISALHDICSRYFTESSLKEAAIDKVAMAPLVLYRYLLGIPVVKYDVSHDDITKSACRCIMSLSFCDSGV